MCYSPQAVAGYRAYGKRFGAEFDIDAFAQLFRIRLSNNSIKLPQAVDASFSEPRSAADQEIQTLSERFRTEQTNALEQEIFKQKKRLADAQRKQTKLQSRHRKPTHSISQDNACFV